MKQLILGGARSGKSSLAETLAKASGKEVIYIATADARYNDLSMDQRIQHHQQNRPSEWPTIEEPVLLAEQLTQQASAQHCLLVDCLSLWLSNCLMQDDNSVWQQQRQQLLDTLATLPGDLILVGNEVGSGIIPMGEINRRFVDETGFLHQTLAQQCDRVILTAAGLPLVLKGEPLS
ncbi:bifunctional adenosylcobinamide kinase/adenosylcobinamide-phosphate guanylyltransferase [uncultured Oceanicoccus sp.]|uniref:bifunctional adenosylcobinamide kinase/adenosylcobinamide-phosphate guanylyltransferase n=1 Tax=uncultured Oceanicoccus sp. TaxID=1706381 RepID=UPI0030DC9C41